LQISDCRFQKANRISNLQFEICNLQLVQSVPLRAAIASLRLSLNRPQSFEVEQLEQFAGGSLAPAGRLAAVFTGLRMATQQERHEHGAEVEVTWLRSTTMPAGGSDLSD